METANNGTGLTSAYSRRMIRFLSVFQPDGEPRQKQPHQKSNEGNAESAPPIDSLDTKQVSVLKKWQAKFDTGLPPADRA